MQVLLINQNATIERLVKLSAGKLGYELVCAKDISDVRAGEYGFVIMDSDLYNRDEFELLKQKFELSKYILIISKGVEKPEGFDIYVEKPFLPTEMVDILSANAPSKTAADKAMPEEESVDDVPNQTLDEEKLSAENEPGELEFSGETPSLDNKKSLVQSFADTEGNTHEIENSEFDEEEPLTLDEGESEDMRVNLDEQLEELGDLDDVFTSVDETNSVDGEPKLSLNGDLESDLSRDFEGASDEPARLDGDSTNDSGSAEEELSLDMDELNAKKEEISEIKDGLELGSESEPDGSGGFEKEMEDTDNEEVVNPHIFDEDEVNKLKNLLDETEDGSSEADELDMENIKIHNDELGSLTEESLAEALGVNINSTPKEEEPESTELDEPLAPSLPTASVEEQKIENLSSNAIQLNPNQSITLSLDALKELLNIADVTINITLSKKR